MKVYAVGLLSSVVMLLSAPGAAAAPTPSPPPHVPPWISVPLTGGGGLTPGPGSSLSVPLPSGMPTEMPPVGGALPTPPRERPSAGTGEPSPTQAPESTARAESRETPTRVPAVPSAPSWEPAGKGHVPPGEYDLFVDPEGAHSGSTGAGEDGGQSGGEDGLSFGAEGPLLPVLPLGAGIASLGLGLGALGLRMRRRA